MLIRLTLRATFALPERIRSLAPVLMLGLVPEFLALPSGRPAWSQSL